MPEDKSDIMQIFFTVTDYLVIEHSFVVSVVILIYKNIFWGKWSK